MYFILFIVTVSAFVVPIYARRVGGSHQNIIPSVGNRPQESKTASSVSPSPSASSKIAEEDIVRKLDDLLLQEITDDLWHEKANDLIVELASFDKNASNTYFKKVLNKMAQGNAKKIVPAPIPKKAEQEVPKPIKPLEKPSLIPKTTIQQDSNAKQEITKKLDDLLQQKEIDDVWYATIDDLIFDLALIDRNISNEYLKKIRMKTAITPAATVPPTPDKTVQKAVPAIPPAGMPKGTPPPSPASKGTPSSFATPRSVQGEREADASAPPPGQQMQKGTPPPPPSSGSMKKGSPSSFAKAPSFVKTSAGTSAETPPPPSGGMQKGTPPPPPPGAGPKKGGPPPPPPGPMVKGKKAASPTKGPSSPVAPKGPDPLTIKESYSLKQLERRTAEEVTQLFNDLLEALIQPRFWDDVKKQPVLEWENKINTTKKALLNKKSTIDLTKAVADRIAQVKIEKAKEGLAKQAAAEKKEETKQQEEFSETELIAKIEALKKREKVDDMFWLIEFQGSVKKLDKVNHEKALTYESEFIKKFPGQKSFLPKKKPLAVK